MFRLLKPKRSPEEQKEILQARQTFSNELQTATVNIKTSSERNEFLPETTSYLYSLVKTTQTWLNQNPDADLLELSTKKNEFASNYKQTADTESKRKFFLTWMAAIASSSKDLLSSKKLKEPSYKKIQSLLNDIAKWYKEKAFTATVAEFEQQANDVRNQTDLLLESNPNKEFVKKRFEQIQTFTPQQVRAELDKYNIVAQPQTDLQKKEAATRAQLQKQADENAKPVDPFDVILKKALETFFALLIFVFCLLGGSLAANFAIGRTRPYRVLYFLYGAIPIFSPFVILYAIYKRIREGPLHFYGILPLSVEPATTRLGKLLWYPFYWVPDGNVAKAADVFAKSLIV